MRDVRVARFAFRQKCDRQLITMEALLQFVRKLSLLFGRDRFRRDLEEEMAFHRERLERELEEDGVEHEEATYVARRRFGNELQLREQAHSHIAFPIETVVQDFRYAARQLRRNY